MTGAPFPGRSPAAGWRSRRRALVAVVLVVALLAGVLVSTGSTDPVRPFVVFVFLVLGPGLAVTGFLRLPDPATELALAIPLSLALDVAVAAGMSLATAWRPGPALIGSVVVAGAALALQLRRPRPVPAADAEPAAAAEPAEDAGKAGDAGKAEEGADA